jgi:hypothetical protein
MRERLERIARSVDPAASVKYVFDDGVWVVMAPGRRDAPLSEEFIADHSDAQVVDEIRLRWQLPR